MCAGSPPRSADVGWFDRPNRVGSTTRDVTEPARTHHTDDVVSNVSSSSPSSPRNTAASRPREANTPATIGAIRASATPTAAYVG